MPHRTELTRITLARWEERGGRREQRLEDLLPLKLRRVAQSGRLSTLLSGSLPLITVSVPVLSSGAGCEDAEGCISAPRRYGERSSSNRHLGARPRSLTQPTKKPRTEVRGSFVWLAYASIRSGSSHQRTPYELCRRWSGRCYRYRAADPKRSKPAAGRC